MNFKISNLGIISSPKMVKNNARIAILFADAPCHGNKYCDIDIRDNYPDGIVPNRRNIEELIEELAKNDISLYCTEITEYTRKMYKIFNDIYKNYQKCDFKLIPLKTNINITNMVGDICFEIYSKHRF